MSSSSISTVLSTILIMKPKPSPVPLIRIGGQKDGAYLIPDDLDDIKACFSPGVANRKTFEDELTDAHGIQCHMCDKSSDIGKFQTPLKEGMQTFKKKWLDVNGETDSISLDAWVEELAPDQKDDLMLQMDIEGAEYRNILHTSDQILKRFRIIIVEVHRLGVARNSQEFEVNLGPFLRRLNEHFICVHAHPNNCCGDFIIPGTNINLPNVYELTFLRRDRFNEKNLSSWHEPMMPHPLDIKRNVDKKPPIFLSEESPTQVPRTQASTIKLLEDKLDYYMSTISRKEVENHDTVFKIYKLAQSIANNSLLEEDINLDELDEKDIIDVAEGKHYYLSSSYVNYPKEGLIETKQPFFFHTGFGIEQYITIDLEKEYILTSLLIVNRIDSCKERSRCLFYTLHNVLKPNLSFALPLNIDESFWQGDKLECRTSLKKVKARYITIFSPENTALHFSSIKVFGVCSSHNINSRVNLALNKPTIQSSIYLSEYDPYGACNGKKTGKFGFHTNRERQPWWQIDLQEIYQLSQITIYNRMDTCSERASTLNILLSLDALSWELYYSNDQENVFGGIDGKPLRVEMKDKIARFVRLQLRKIEYFHLDEVEIYGLPLQESDRLRLYYNQDEESLSANFYSHASIRPSPPPKEIPASLKVDFTLDNRIPVIHAYFNNTSNTYIHISSLQSYHDAFEKLENGSFKYYGKTLDHLLNSLDKYSIFGKTVLIFGLAGINCDAISLWKGAKDVYVIDYNLPVSEHPQVHILSYEDYIKHNIQTDVAISISSFEHDGLGRYGDPINPNGDLEAMKLAKQLIKKDGLLFFSVPIGQDCIVWNAHRIYGKIRLPMMLEGWKIVDSFGFSEALMINQDLGRFEQPIFVLKNL